MHTQTETAALIIARGAHYVMTVKANMPTLYSRLKKLPWADVPATSTVTMGRGRRIRRTIKVAVAPTWIEFEGAVQVAQLRRTVTVNGKQTTQVVHLITSAAEYGTSAAGNHAGAQPHQTRRPVKLEEPACLLGASPDPLAPPHQHQPAEAWRVVKPYDSAAVPDRHDDSAVMTPLR